MIFYTREAEALALGYTHHGKYYGVPIWISPKSEPMAVQAKCLLLEPFMDLFTLFEQLSFAWGLNPNPGFKFLVGRSIKLTGKLLNWDQAWNAVRSGAVVRSDTVEGGVFADHMGGVYFVPDQCDSEDVDKVLPLTGGLRVFAERAKDWRVVDVKAGARK